MNLRRVLPFTLLALVVVIIVLATWDKRPLQREEASSIKAEEPVVAQNDHKGPARAAMQVASIRHRKTTARSRGVYRRTVAPTTQVASVQHLGSTARSRGVYRGNTATAGVHSPRQGGMKIPGTGVGLWPKS